MIVEYINANFYKNGLLVIDVTPEVEAKYKDKDIDIVKKIKFKNEADVIPEWDAFKFKIKEVIVASRIKPK